MMGEVHIHGAAELQSFSQPESRKHILAFSNTSVPAAMKFRARHSTMGS